MTRCWGERPSPTPWRCSRPAASSMPTRPDSSASLFSPPNPVRLPGNWQDRTMANGKLTYSPIKGLKLLGTESWSPQPAFLSLRLHRRGQLFRGLGWWTADGFLLELPGPASWSRARTGCSGGDRSLITCPRATPAAPGATTCCSARTGISGRAPSAAPPCSSATRRFRSQEINNSSQKTNWERDTFLSWGASRRPVRSRDLAGPGRSLDRQELRDLVLPGRRRGLEAMRAVRDPVRDAGEGTFYYLNYSYLREKQDNYKADMDFQVNRRNRAKLGAPVSPTSTTTGFRTSYTSGEARPAQRVPLQPVDLRASMRRTGPIWAISSSITGCATMGSSTAPTGVSPPGSVG